MNANSFDINTSLIIITNELKKLEENGCIRSKHLVGDLGEYYACKNFGFSQVKSLNQTGYDALDIENKRVQIKTRRLPEPQNKITFSSLDFDYCIFVELDEYFKPIEFRKASREVICNNLERTRQRLSVRVFRNISEIITNEI